MVYFGSVLIIVQLTNVCKIYSGGWSETT